MTALDGVSPSLLIWSAARPVVKLFLVMAFGFVLAKLGYISATTSKAISSIIVYALYPFLMFVSVLSISQPSQLGQAFVVLMLYAVLYLGLGSIFGYLIMRYTKPPAKFKWGSMMATACGNFTDVPIAILLSIGDSPLFGGPGGGTIAVAYIAVFAVPVVVYFFVVGFRLISEDFRSDSESEVLIESVDSQHTTHANEDTVTNEQMKTLVVDAKESAYESGSSSAPTASAMHVLVPIEESSAELGDSSKNLVAEPDRHSLEHNSRPMKTHRSGFSKIKSFYDALMVKYRTDANFRLWLESTIFNSSNISVVLGLVVVFVPWLRNLFVYSDPSNKPALNQEPPLRVLYDFATFVGGAAPPLGVILLGAGLGRVKLSKMLPFRVIGSIVLVRLVIIPIIGFVISYFVFTGLNIRDKILWLVVTFESGVPTAISCMYFTIIANPSGDATDVTSLLLVIYPLSAITMTVMLLLSILLMPF
ncbi:auxin efflux carrier [Cladochytrium replicatum]|nr:auxin efflux carrier [Cladochytrium replicatum]